MQGAPQSLVPSSAKDFFLGGILGGIHGDTLPLPGRPDGSHQQDYGEGRVDLRPLTYVHVVAV